MRKLNVLAVDDEPLSLELATIILAAEGHSVTAATNGEQALELLLAQGLEFDLVVLDNVMPGVDGLTVVTRLREHPRTKCLPVICTSASASSSSKQAGLLVGCDHYLTKPFKRAELLTAVKETIAQAGNKG